MLMQKAVKDSSREFSYSTLQGSLFKNHHQYKNYVHLRDTFIFENTYHNKHLLSFTVELHLRN